MSSNLKSYPKKQGKIVVFRERFLRLLNWPKPLREQLILEFPTLNALRTEEVAQVKVEHIDLERGDLQVLDSKKHTFFTVPLDYTLGKHLQQYVATTGLREGLLFVSRRRKSMVRGSLSNQGIEQVWKKWCLASGIPYMPPRYGRAFFAADWHIVQGKSLIGLMHVLRHEKLETTYHYLERIYCYEDAKAEFNRGMDSPFLSACARSDKCPMAAEDCYCRMYSPGLGAIVPRGTVAPVPEG